MHRCDRCNVLSGAARDGFYLQHNDRAQVFVVGRMYTGKERSVRAHAPRGPAAIDLCSSQRVREHAVVQHWLIFTAPKAPPPMSFLPVLSHTRPRSAFVPDRMDSDGDKSNSRYAGRSSFAKQPQRSRGNACTRIEISRWR